jgi:uncharacterized phage protein gp47/JayE
MGPNGSGKSTLAYAIAGHPKYTIASGTVTLGNLGTLSCSWGDPITCTIPANTYVGPLPAADSVGGRQLTVTRADGAVYTTTANGTISGGAVTVAAESELAGADYNLEVNQDLTLGQAIAGVDSDVETASTTTTGTDEETDNELRDRLLQRIQDTPQGGSADDYERWAREISGVFRSLCVPLPRGAGSVDVYFLHDEGTGYGIPTAPQIAEVQAYIDELRPVTASDVQVKAPSTTTVAYTFTALAPNDATTQGAIEDEIDAMFLAKALRSLAAGTPEPIYISDHWQAIAAAAGVVSFEITAPAADLTPTAGQVYIRGAMTYPP